MIPRFPVTALLVGALSTLGPLARARPPDPTWPILLGRVALSTRRAGRPVALTAAAIRAPSLARVV